MMRSCPFCGKADMEHAVVKDRSMGGYDDDPEIYQVRCEWCGARGQEAGSKKLAIKLWEERA